ncbi:MAG: mechanosensitive ion channel [Candidatus Omnitrophica bacterium]|nr:mechanosensitive ion channel [Candidatus Omnitrophota bacterium]
MEAALAKISEIGVPLIANVLAAAIIYIVGKWAAGILADITRKIMHRAKVDEALVGFTAHLVEISVFIFALMAAIGKLGIQTTSFIAVLGAAGLAVGLALQGTLSNFAAGVMILFFKPFRLGDKIEAAGTAGAVKEIQIFNTIIAGPDNCKIIIPNAQITSGVIRNFSAMDRRRIDLIFSVSYSDNLQTAKKVLADLTNADARILKDPAAVIAVFELAESGVDIICRPWVKPADYWDVRFDLIEKGKFALESAGCCIPFPQRDVHLIQPVEKTLESARFNNR